ncbi:4-(cytidine 5'-diphospho)-2-C-methyl-D-erythritol kinase [candidate division KSB1 bacterium]|nr:4-(cytidine 5'-diphospho)-2-C-methyl-D-erythritol kinase [candidate division KSB1 bacterium]
MKRCHVLAYAKLNLSLRVLGKRTDGYHELDTYFLQVDLADELSFETSEHAGIELSCNWNSVPLDDSNLCARAFHLIAKAINREPGIRLHLEKRIPLGAGMGGGSSDAAVTLMVLNFLFDAGLSPEDLASLARKLGSDVPFFLYGGLCHGSGRGEVLTPLAHLPELYALIVTPDIALATAAVYQNLKIGLTSIWKNTIFADLNYDVVKFYRQHPMGQNDLEGWVLEQFPLLAQIKQKLIVQGAIGASMTGSGSAVFGLFETFAAAQSAQQVLQAEFATHIARPVKWGMKEINKALNPEVFVG